MTSRDFCFTIFQVDGFHCLWDTDPYWAYLQDLHSDVVVESIEGVEQVLEEHAGDVDIPTQLGIKYICYQLERCPKTQRIHIQGYLQCVNAVRFPGAKRVLGFEHAHLGPKQGTPEQAAKYTKKEESRIGRWFEHGTCPVGAGKRSDLSRVSEDIHAGHSIRDIAFNHTTAFIRYHRGIGATIRLFASPPARPKIKVLVLSGSTGTGKSRWCLDNFPKAFWWPESANGSHYAMGYDGIQRVIVFDDFPNGMRFSFLLRLLDRYPLSVNVQGENTPFMGDLIIITTNFPITSWYEYVDINGRVLRNLPALRRRITQVYNTDLGEFPSMIQLLDWTKQPPTPPHPEGGGRR